MKTYGHEDIAQNAGIPLLKEKLSAIGKPDTKTTAFYFGNWLTDISQVVDPVAIENVVKENRDKIPGLVDRLVHYIDVIISESPLPDSAITYLRSKVNERAKYAKKKIQLSLDALVLKGNNQRDSELFKVMRVSCRIKAYFKFAHSEIVGDKALPMPVFTDIFKQYFTQYYPHEHLDRPETPPGKKPPVYASDKGADIYKYLSKDIRYVAGLLTETEIEWAMRAFNPHDSFSDTGTEWHLGLAKLGHALHGMEDFFAHSIFIEHAALLLGGKFIPPENTMPVNNRFIPDNLKDIDRTLFFKRLKRYVPGYTGNWQDLPLEDSIITGFFGSSDIIVAAIQFLIETLGIEMANPQRDISKAKEIMKDPNQGVNEAEKLLRNAIELIESPSDALKDKDNSVAQGILKKYGDDYGKHLKRLNRQYLTQEVIEKLFKDFPLFEDVDPSVKKDIANFIILLTKLRAIGSIAVSFYSLLQTLQEFIIDPVEWCAKLLLGKAYERLKEYLKFGITESIFELFGRSNIGSHALISKDVGNEWLYKEAKDCATAVHWYAVKQMTRWAQGQTTEPLNWLELLEFFLRHPKTAISPRYAEVTYALSIDHLVKDGDTLKNLAEKYRPTAMHKDSFTWKTIADENFGTHNLSVPQTQRMVNKLIADRSWGYPVSKPNWAFKGGITIRIPDQKFGMTVALPDDDKKTWYKEVMNKGWKVFKGYEDKEYQASMPGMNFHKPVFYKNISEAKAFISETQKLRQELEKSYSLK